MFGRFGRFGRFGGGYSVVRLFGYSIIAFLISGCQSYTILQRNVFADDDGNVVVVDYGRSERDHVNAFTSPVTGASMDFKSKLMVEVQLPDGDRAKAWQCMNFLPMGTMYLSENSEWRFLANGFSFVVYRRTDDTPPLYAEVYRGVLCETSDVEIKKNSKWKKVLPPVPLNQSVREPSSEQKK